jgi:AcrR family transcriptional regulator
MQPKANRQTARSQATCEQIVQAALTVFAMKGYAASSMDDICMAAGCSKGGLYHHFPTKSAVLSSVADQLAESGVLLPPLVSNDGALPLPPTAIGRVLLEIWAEAARDDGLRSRLRTGYEACLERSFEAGLPDHRPLAEILRIGVLVQLLTRADTTDADAAARRLGIERAA